MGDLDRLEKRLQDLLDVADCPKCEARIATCNTCGRKVGANQLDLQRARDELVRWLDHYAANPRMEIQ